MKNIVLIGMMGSGKSTCAALLARRLSRPLADMDAIIAQRAGRSVAALFAEEGEARFRAAESALAKELGALDGHIIATGGGAVLREENVAALRKNGILVFLNRPADEIFSRESMDGRPLAQGGKARFLELFAAREPVYRAAADVVIGDFSSPEETASRILEACEVLL